MIIDIKRKLWYDVFVNKSYYKLYIGVSPSGKATGSDPVTRKFESYHPSQKSFCSNFIEQKV